MAALSAHVAAAIARLGDPLAAEQRRVDGWLRSLPRKRRRQVLRAYVVTVDGKPTAVYDQRVLVSRSRQMVTPHLIAHLGLTLPPLQWSAICDAADGVRLIDESQALTIRDAIGKLPGRWRWPKTWYCRGLIYAEYTHRTVETRPIANARKK